MTLSLVKTHESPMLQRLLPLVKGFDHIEVEIGGFEKAVNLARNARASGQCVYFVGNGGSQAIASHMAADWTKNGRFSASALSDPSALTCIANDLGYESIYAEQLRRHAVKNDLLFAISSSGQSMSIINAVTVAQTLRMNVVTLSGFRPDNALRNLRGEVNFYVPSSRYMVVEIAHLAILHSILDQVMDVDGR